MFDTSVFSDMIFAFWRVLLIPITIFVVSFALFGFWVVCFFLVAFFRGSRRPEGVHNSAKRPSALYALFIQFPRQYVRDYFSRNPEYFRYQGLIVFTGRQGSGKTVALVEQTLKWQQEYPKAKVISNLNYQYQDNELTNWTQLVDYANGIQGVIVQMDELQNWFSSNQSKNFPPEFLEVITQNRKNRRVILGTSQVFTRLSKPLREQCTEVRKCFTFFGCVTLVLRKEPVLDSAGEVLEYRNRGFYWFVHTQQIREAYDTYHVIESLSKSGFQPTNPAPAVPAPKIVFNMPKK